MIGRALLAIVIVATTLHQAAAQSGGMPGPPGSGMPGGGFGGAPQGLPPKCQALLDIRDELEKHHQAIEAANQKKADLKLACGLFRRYIAIEAKMLTMLEADGPFCGAPPHLIQQFRDSHAQAQQTGKQVCDAASRSGVTGRPDPG